MELRSRRSLRFSQQLADRISALPDDLLLLILARLSCIGTAVHTSILSRRWRNLWRLLSALAFRDVKYSSLEPALASVSPRVSLLEIHVPMIVKFSRTTPSGGRGARAYPSLGGAAVTSLLRAAARIEPEVFVISLPPNQIHGYVDMSCFHRATTITLDTRAFIHFRLPSTVEFGTLETLSLSGNIVGLDDLIPQCPRLRVLTVTRSSNQYLATVHSSSLQELFMDSIGCAHRVNIFAPALRQLTMSLRPSEQVNISILAPMVDTIFWYCSYYYASLSVRFSHWILDRLKLQRAERQGQLPSLHIHASICPLSYPHQVDNFKHEIEKHMVASFSTLELHLITRGHAFGAFVLHLIGMNQIRSAMRKLKVILRESEVKKECPNNCHCHPMNWKVQTISLIVLEEIQIDGFGGEDHEFDFLRLVFKSAPMLKRVIVKLTHEDSSISNGCKELCDLFRAYSAVECCVYLRTNECVLHT